MSTRIVARFSVVLVVVLLTALGAVVPASAAPRPVTVSGTWDNADPLTVTVVSQNRAITVLGFDGVSRWSGDLTGPTSFTGRGLLPTRPAVLVGTISETFTGSVAGIGSGTLRFVETFRQDVTTGAITIDAQVVGGTGALSTVRGYLRFVGVTDADGVGGGTYSGGLAGTR